MELTPGKLAADLSASAERSLEDRFKTDPAVDQVFMEPVRRSSVTAEYKVPEYEGMELKIGRRLVFLIPEELRSRVVRDVILHHRKGEKYRVGINSSGYDPHGAYSRVELHNPEKDAWVGWKDPMGYNPDKFAEPRPASDPEVENLHDWLATVGPVRTDAVRVTNVGQNPEYSVTQIHGLEINFFPESRESIRTEKIYSPGTNFIDLEKNILLPSYGGGEHSRGVYEGAVVLNMRRKPGFSITENPGPGVEKQNSRLLIDAKPDSHLLQVEVAIGDSENIGDRVRLGWAKLWIGVQRAEGGETEWFTRNTNIPPQGVLTGGPEENKSLLRSKDKIIVEVRADTAYVMGWRVTYKKENIADVPASESTN